MSQTVKKLVSIVTDKATSDVTINYTDASGKNRSLLIPRRLADAIIMALLTNPPLRQPDATIAFHREPLVAHGCSSVEDKQTGRFALVFDLGNGAALPIGFPAEARKRLIDILANEAPPIVWQ